jgi:hypothetical protein
MILLLKMTGSLGLGVRVASLILEVHVIYYIPDEFYVGYHFPHPKYPMVISTFSIFRNFNQDIRF